MGISNIESNLRPGICTSTTRPTTPYEGQVIYETDTDRVLVWDNAAWVDPSTGKTGRSGLVKITPSSVSGTGATIQSNGSVKVASGGIDVTISGIFSSSFENYEIVVSNWQADSVRALLFGLRNSGGTSVTGYYTSTSYGVGFYNGTGNMVAVGTPNSASANTDALTSSTTQSGAKWTFFQPFLAKTTGYTGFVIDARTSGNGRHGFSGFHNVATSYTDLVIGQSAGTITSMTVEIYGYN
jgi:hypothetical protein